MLAVEQNDVDEVLHSSLCKVSCLDLGMRNFPFVGGFPRGSEIGRQ